MGSPARRAGSKRQRAAAAIAARSRGGATAARAPCRSPCRPRRSRPSRRRRPRAAPGSASGGYSGWRCSTTAGGTSAALGVVGTRSGEGDATPFWANVRPPPSAKLETMTAMTAPRGRARSAFRRERKRGLDKRISAVTRPRNRRGPTPTRGRRVNGGSTDGRVRPCAARRGLGARERARPWADVEQPSIVLVHERDRASVCFRPASAQAEGGEVLGALASTNTRPGLTTTRRTSRTIAGGGV